MFKAHSLTGLLLASTLVTGCLSVLDAGGLIESGNGARVDENTAAADVERSEWPAVAPDNLDGTWRLTVTGKPSAGGLLTIRYGLPACFYNSMEAVWFNVGSNDVIAATGTLTLTGTSFRMRWSVVSDEIGAGEYVLDESESVFSGTLGGDGVVRGSVVITGRHEGREQESGSYVFAMWRDRSLDGTWELAVADRPDASGALLIENGLLRSFTTAGHEYPLDGEPQDTQNAPPIVTWYGAALGMNWILTTDLVDAGDYVFDEVEFVFDGTLSEDGTIHGTVVLTDSYRGEVRHAESHAFRMVGVE